MTSVLTRPVRPPAVRSLPSGVPTPVVALAVVSCTISVVSVARAHTLTPLSVATWAFMLVVVMVFSPVTVVRGASVVVALVSAFTLAPNNTTLLNQYIGLGMANLALVGGLVRTIGGRSAPGKEPRHVFALGWTVVYLGVMAVSTAISPVAASLRDVLFLSVVPLLLVSVLARGFTAADLRVLARGVVGFAVGQAIAATIDVFVTPVPFLGYAFYLRSANEFLLGAVDRSQGLAGHSIPLAVVLGAALLLVWRDVVQLSRRARVGVGVVIAWGFVLSGARSALVALLIAVVLLSIVHAKSVAARVRSVVLMAGVLIAAVANQRLFDAVLHQAVQLGQTGSYFHRAAAITGVPELLASRSALPLLIGSGSGSERSLYGAGLLQQDGLYVIDNQFVTAIAVTGVLGFLALVVLIVRSVVRSGPALCSVIVFLVIMFNSFDLLRWAGPALLFFALVAVVDRFGTGRTEPASPPD